VAVEYRRRPQAGRVGARDLGLGHREERPRVADDERPEPAILLLLGAEEMQNLAVARVRGLAVEDELPPDAAADLLVQVRVGEEAAARPAGLGREVRRPEPFRLRAGAKVGDQRRRIVVLPRERLLVRVDVRLHEGAIRGLELFHRASIAQAMLYDRPTAAELVE